MSEDVRLDAAGRRLSRRQLLRQGAKVTVVAGAGVLASSEHALAQPATRAPRWAMVIDVRRCIGCRACTVACKAEFSGALGTWRSCVIQKDGNGRRGFLPLLCNHCERPDLPCIDVCPGDERTDVYTAPDGSKIEYKHRASYRRPDGAVLVAADLCIGCGLCIRACPYGARFFDPNQAPGSERAIGDSAAAKCTYCVHRIDQGIAPSCVNTCQGRARIFGDLNDPDSEVSRLLKQHRTQRLLEEENTDPHTHYIALPEGVYQRYPEGGNFSDGI